MPLSACSRRQIIRTLGLGLPAAAVLGACTPAEPSTQRPTAGRRVREVVQRVDAQATSDGAGVRLRQSLGTRSLPMLDPFLMLDEFRSDRPEDYIAGFPSHPHRGFETVTYMLEGAMEHEDSLGNRGRLVPGSTQWMTAGRGIVHSEMPKQEKGLMWGFQLWVNLPAVRKMVKPRYQDLAPDRIVELAIGDAAVRLVAGEAAGRRGPVEGIATSPAMLDVKLPAGGRFEHAMPASHNAFIYVFDGMADVGPVATRATRGQIAVLGPGDVVSISSEQGGRMLLFGGQPIGEPVARRGPFVMNTEAELEKAFEDYRAGRLAGG